MRPSQVQALAPLENAEALSVRQKKEWGEILTGWETRNRYEISDGSGQALFFAGETGGRLGAVLLRAFLRNRRPFHMEIRNPSGEVVLDLDRPWRWFFATLEVSNRGRLLGRIEQRFRLFSRHYEVLGADGELLATIEGPFFRPWTFMIRREGTEAGSIRKKWSGLGREMFTDADNFRVELAPGLDSLLRQLILGATFLIDFVHFENR